MAQEFSSSEIEDIVKSWMKETPEASDQEASEFFSIFGDKAIEVYNNSFLSETNPSGKTKGSWVPDIATAKKEEAKFNGKAKRYGHVLTIKNPDKNSWPQGITTKTGYIRTLGFDMTTQMTIRNIFQDSNRRIIYRTTNNTPYTAIISFEGKRGAVADEAYAVIKTEAPYGADSYKVVNDKYTAKKVANIKNSALGDDNTDTTYIYRKINQENAEKYGLPRGAVEAVNEVPAELLKELEEAEQEYLSTRKIYQERSANYTITYREANNDARGGNAISYASKMKREAKNRYDKAKETYEHTKALVNGIKKGLTPEQSLSSFANKVTPDKILEDLYRIVDESGLRDRGFGNRSARKFHYPKDGKKLSIYLLGNRPDEDYYDLINKIVKELNAIGPDQNKVYSIDLKNSTIKFHIENLSWMASLETWLIKKSKADNPATEGVNKMKKPLTTKLKKLANASESQEELYGLEALEKTGLASLQSVLATQLEEQGSTQVIENILNLGQDLGSDYLDQVSFIKNTTDLSDTNLVLNELINASETLLDDIQIEQLVESLGSSDPGFEEEPMGPEFGDEEYQEPDDWGSVDSEEPIEEEPEETSPDIDNEDGEAHEALESLTNNKSLDEEEAYNYFNEKFYDWLESLEDEPTPEQWKAFADSLNSAPYDRDLLQWIWDEVAELGDDGYSYDEFVSICGNYPGNYTDWQQVERPAEEAIPSTGKSLVERLKALGTANEDIDSDEGCDGEGNKIVNGYVIRKANNSDSYFVYDNRAHVEDEEHKGQGYPSFDEAKKRALSLEKGIAEGCSKEVANEDLGGYDRLVDPAFVEGSDE